MIATDLTALSQRLEATSAAGGLSSLAEDLRVAARLASALSKLQQAAEQQPGWGWRCFLEPGKVRLEYGFWSHEGYQTALDAIEGATPCNQ